MNRTRRKALKMLKRRYGRATNPLWQAQPQANQDREALRASMRDAYNRCTRGPLGPHTITTDGSVLNEITGTQDYTPGELYDVPVS